MSEGAEVNLAAVPSVDRVLQAPEVASFVRDHGREVVIGWTRECLAHARTRLRESPNGVARDDIFAHVVEAIQGRATASTIDRLGPVINATGVTLHTNLGRAPLAESARRAVADAARSINLEMDLASGDRRYRGYQVEQAFRDLTGAESALVVNNCAAATLLCLAATAAGREVIVARGQLIEIGGAYRLPDVFAASGAILREVGTTNRVRLDDYQKAIGPNTAAILRVHESNFRVVGFTEKVSIGPLADLAHANGLLGIDDLGSGCLVDLAAKGLPAEPTVGASLAEGADLVLFSGDKLLGGPQAGVILGKQNIVERIRRHPLARAVRVDKLTLAAMQATLELYLTGRAWAEIPVLSQLARSAEDIRSACDRVLGRLTPGDAWRVEVSPDASAVGGGSLPLAELATWTLTVSHARLSADEIAHRLRTGSPRVVPRIKESRVWLDLRAVSAEEEDSLAAALAALLAPN